MKPLSLAYILLFAIAACTPSIPTTSTTAPPARAAEGYAAGSAANTTTAFDGTYTFLSVQNMTQAGAAPGLVGQGSALPATGIGTSAVCPNYTAAPPLVISNGLAEFDVLNLRFQGYVTPQGSLTMSSGQGQHFEGQINPQGVITGREIGACVYNLSWQKSA
jgi:hypothetical protein